MAIVLEPLHCAFSRVMTSSGHMASRLRVQTSLQVVKGLAKLFFWVDIAVFEQFSPFCSLLHMFCGICRHSRANGPISKVSRCAKAHGNRSKGSLPPFWAVLTSLTSVGCGDSGQGAGAAPERGWGTGRTVGSTSPPAWPRWNLQSAVQAIFDCIFSLFPLACFFAYFSQVEDSQKFHPLMTLRHD